MRGTHVRRKASAVTRPPGRPSTHGESCPSLHRFGTIIAKLGDVADDARSLVSRERSTSPAAHAGVSMIEWKYTKGLWRAAYWSPGRAFCVSSRELSAGWRHAVPMSSM